MGEQPVLGLRAAAGLLLGSVLLFFPFEAWLLPSERGWLATLAVILAAIAIVTLLVSVSAAGTRHARGISVCFLLATQVATLLYGFVLPSHDVVTTNALTANLIVGVALFEWGILQALAVAVFALGGFAVVTSLSPRTAAGPTPPGLALASVAMWLVIPIVVASVLARHRAAVAARERELATLSARLMTVQEKERGRIARALHEGVGQSLTALLSYFWLIEQRLPGDLPELRASTAEGRRLAAQTLTDIRELSQQLRPSVLDDYGLAPSLEAYARGVANRGHLDLTFSATGLPERLPADVETAVYRIAQEALRNVTCHASATRVRVALAAADRELCLEVEDDGVGLLDNGVEAGASQGTGLVGIRERVRVLGGSVTIDSADGMRLAVRVPLPS